MAPSETTSLSGTKHIHVSQHEERMKLRQQRIGRATYPYAFRSCTNTRSPAPKQGRSSSKANQKRGRLEDWETEILQYTFKSGIWNPGNGAVRSLINELQGNRSTKQVRDWFSHQRRLVRENGASSTQGKEDPDKSVALDGLIFLKHPEWRNTDSDVVTKGKETEEGGVERDS